MTIAAVIAFSPLDHLVERVRQLMEVAAEGAVDFLLALVVAAVGWALAELLSRLTRWVLRTLRFNEGARAVLGWRADRPMRLEEVFRRPEIGSDGPRPRLLEHDLSTT